MDAPTLQHPTSISKSAAPEALVLRRGQEWLQLGPLRVAAWVHEKNIPGVDYRITSEAKGATADEHNVQVTAHDLLGVRARDLPKSMNLVSFEPRLGFSAIQYVGARTNDDGQCTMTIVATLHYDQFHLPCNLQTFAKRLTAYIHTSAGAVEFDGVQESKTEYVGIDIEAKLALPLDADLGKAAMVAGAQMLECYKRLVKEILGGASPQATPEPGAVRWWAKEFVVPLATSVIGAVFGWLASRA